MSRLPCSKTGRHVGPNTPNTTMSQNTNRANSTATVSVTSLPDPRALVDGTTIPSAIISPHHMTGGAAFDGALGLADNVALMEADDVALALFKDLPACRC
jgi:hypothetical protein